MPAFADAGLLRFIVDRINVGIVAVNENFEIVLWNRFLESYSHRSAAEVLGKNLFDAFPDLPQKWLERKIKGVFIMKNFSFTSWEQRPYLLKFSHNRPITGGVDSMRQDCTFMPVKSADDHVQYVCLCLYDVTDTSMYQEMLKEAMNTLAEASNRDGLTGIYNRRFLESTLTKEFERTRRYGGNLSFFLLDLDFFKRINDTYGHLAGDEVLRQTSNRILQAIRAPDTAGRYGGEEFGVILPETPVAGARIVAERLRHAIASKPVMFNNIPIPITTSIGISEVHEGIANYEALIHEADTALYKSKTDGRNRVTCSQPGLIATGSGSKN